MADGVRIGKIGGQVVVQDWPVAVGVLSSTAIAQSAGVASGEHSALRVTRTMATNVSDVYAAGDCIET
jgi:pyruvate/2-oxoglutarate dehydrogenase complex dihydrolipoamide dehydrogenase (E3) component